MLLLGGSCSGGLAAGGVPLLHLLLLPPGRRGRGSYCDADTVALPLLLLRRLPTVAALIPSHILDAGGGRGRGGWRRTLAPRRRTMEEDADAQGVGEQRRKLVLRRRALAVRRWSYNAGHMTLVPEEDVVGGL